MDSAFIITCPLTGRVGSYVPGRNDRPGAPAPRFASRPLPEDTCPFCAGDVPDTSDPPRATRGQARWTTCRNRYPAIQGPGAAAHVVYSEDHGPPLTGEQSRLRDDWAAMLDVQQQLVARTTSWSLVVTNVGPSAGASQPHPHGQVLQLPATPPVVIERTRRLADPTVARQVLADELTIEAQDGLRLVVPAVPYGPADLRILPETDQGFVDADPEPLAGLITCWTRTVRRDQPDRTAPFDAKLVVHDRTEWGRWYADLLATNLHGPVAGITPFVEIAAPPQHRAATLRVR